MNGSECLVLGAVQTNDKLCCKNNVSLNSTKSLVAFSFGNVGAKEKAHKKKSAEKEFRALRSARRLPQPPPRRLLKKAGENF